MKQQKSFPRGNIYSNVGKQIGNIYINKMYDALNVDEATNGKQAGEGLR